MDYSSNPVKQYEIKQLQSTLKQAKYIGKPESCLYRRIQGYTTSLSYGDPVFDSGLW
jgi:hypothetical protein